MPRNSSTGVYSPPPNITATPLSTIESGDWNALVNDVTATFNAVLPANFGGTGQTSLSSLLSAIGGMPVAGGSFTGPVAMSGDATAALQPVTKQQFDAGLATKAATSHTHSVANITDFNAGVTTAIGTTSINALSDVVSSSPAVGHILRWDGTNYTNVASYTEYNKGVLAQNTTYSQAHGLGVTPSRVFWYFKCRVADAGYAVGDYVSPTGMLPATFHITEFFGTTTVGLVVRQSFAATTIDKGTRLDTAVNMSSWDVVARVFP